ncbi:MAG TPA: biotin transporter BioY, partial [Gemmatimonadales bacterium]|nr:biotin transporter BioY [Gemmatimonadales bacterium]
TALGVLAGLVLIHVGGLAQLVILTGNVEGAARLGTWPFLLGDLAKLAVAVAALTKLTPAVRARL